jgi:hypothetical protein
MTMISGKKRQFLAELRADGAAAAIHTRIKTYPR